MPWRKLAAYGLLIGAGQFGLMFIAMAGHITPGLASLVIQLQAFFTIGLAAYLTGERLQRFQVAALLLSVAGIGVILVHTDAATRPLGLALVLVAALCWAGGNVVVRSTPKVNMLAYVVWASMFSAPPLFVLSFAFEGGQAIRDGLVQADLGTWATVLYQTVANTLFGYAPGGGCCRATRRRPSRPCRCWFRCSEWGLRRYGCVSRCKAGSWRRRRSS